MAVRYAVSPSALGAMLLAQDEVGVCALWLGDEAEPLVAALVAMWPEARRDDASLASAVEAVRAYLSGAGPLPKLALSLGGTELQREVWRALQMIPAGETWDYSALAVAVGRPEATRVVASACGANQLALLVPCHRVVRRDGGLSGFRWGVSRKAALLALEGARPMQESLW